MKRCQKNIAAQSNFSICEWIVERAIVMYVAILEGEQKRVNGADDRK